MGEVIPVAASSTPPRQCYAEIRGRHIDIGADS